MYLYKSKYHSKIMENGDSEHPSTTFFCLQSMYDHDDS